MLFQEYMILLLFILFSIVSGQKPPLQRLDTPCKQKLTNNSGEIRLYYYSVNLSCTWEIMSESRDEKISVLIVGPFNLQQNFDFLLFYDGLNSTKPFINFTGETPSRKVFQSSGNSFKIHFLSDHTESRYGFTISYWILNYNTSKKIVYPEINNQFEFIRNSVRTLRYPAGTIPFRAKEKNSMWNITSFYNQDYYAISFSKLQEPCTEADKYLLKSSENKVINEYKIYCRNNTIPGPIFLLAQELSIRQEKLKDSTEDLKIHYATFAYKKHDDPCSNENLDICDPSKKLRCIEGKCQCLVPDQMKYLEEFKACVSYLGTPCVFEKPFMDGSNRTICLGDQELGQINKSLIKYSDKNIQCNLSNRLCECNDGYYETSGDKSEIEVDRICKLEKGYQEKCSKSKECNSSQFLTCVNEHCDCDIQLNRTYYKDNETERCVGIIGGPCLDDLCQKNSICDELLCYCADGFIETSDGQCVGDYRQVCSNSSLDCSNKFDCLNQTCLCRNNTFFDVNLRVCTSECPEICQKEYNECVCSKEQREQYEEEKLYSKSLEYLNSTCSIHKNCKFSNLVCIKNSAKAKHGKCSLHPEEKYEFFKNFLVVSNGSQIKINLIFIISFIFSIMYIL